MIEYYEMIVESLNPENELEHAGVKGMKWKNHVYKTYETGKKNVKKLKKKFQNAIKKAIINARRAVKNDIPEAAKKVHNKIDRKVTNASIDAKYAIKDAKKKLTPDFVKKKKAEAKAKAKQKAQKAEIKEQQTGGYRRGIKMLKEANNRENKKTSDRYYNLYTGSGKKDYDDYTSSLKRTGSTLIKDQLGSNIKSASNAFKKKKRGK